MATRPAMSGDERPDYQKHPYGVKVASSRFLLAEAFTQARLKTFVRKDESAVQQALGEHALAVQNERLRQFSKHDPEDKTGCRGKPRSEQNLSKRFRIVLLHDRLGRREVVGSFA